MPRKVFTTPSVPHIAPLTGWRKWAAYLPFVRFAEMCYVEVLPNGDMLCHPDTLPELRAWMERNNVRYSVAAKVEVVK